MTDLERSKPLFADSTVASVPAQEVFVLPASLGQERFWGLDRMKPGNPTWSVPVRFRLQGALNVEFMRRAFNEIVRRHEALRTMFSVADGQPVQVIRPTLEIEVPVADLRHLPKAERDTEMDRLSFQEARGGFDLRVGPLLRVGLLRVEDNEHVLLVTPHHSVADYLSIGLISNELGALYEAYAKGSDPALPELRVQYGDYSIWQREQAEGPVVQSELEYWKNQLKDLPLLDFPTDNPRQDLPTYEATITSILLPVGLTDAIKEIANREGATFFNTMLAALAMVMYQYTGQDDFGVATQVAGRTNVEMEPLIGLFINNVVLRMDLSGDPSFSSLVNRVQDRGLQAIANQNLRFEQLLKELRPKDYPSHHTLFRLNFICQRDPVKPLEFAGIKLTVIPSKCQGALYDLNVFLVLRNEGWRLACEYNTDLFGADTITRLLSDYKAAVERITVNPSRRVSEFPLPEGARMARAKRSADGEKVLPPLSLGAAAFASAALADFSAVETETEENPGDVAVLPASIAQRRFWALEEMMPGMPALHMRACVRLTGDLSLARLEQSLQVLVDRHETLRTTFQKSGDDLFQAIHPSGSIDLSVTSLEMTDAADQETKLWEAIRAEASAPFDLFKGPLVRGRLFRLASQDHVLTITSHHIIVDGWSQNIIQSDLWTIYEAATKRTQHSLPPLTIQYGDFAHWQEEWLKSEAASQELAFWKEQLAPPLPVLEFPTDRPVKNRPASHGAMETLLLPEDLTRAMKELSQGQGVTMFMVMLTCYAALLCRYAGQEEIILGSPVANRKPETEGLIGPFASPVTLRLNLSGNPTLKELLHRVRDVIFDALNHAELPFEVLMDHLEVRSVHGRNPLSQCYFFYQVAFLRPRELDRVTITPLPDFALGTHFELQMGLLDRREGLRAQLEYNPDLFDAATIRRVLEDYRKVIELMRDAPEARIDELQISRRAPAMTASEISPARDEPHRPTDETERRLQKIWEGLLDVNPIGLNENYFELGGTSIMAVRLFAQIAKEFQRKLPLSVLFDAQTIAQLAQVLRTEDAPAGWSPLVAVQPKGSRPPFFCTHGGGGNVLIYRDLSRRLGPDQPFYGLQAQGLDGERPFLKTIEEMASLYVNEVRRFQPHGPYYLGGYCMGGTVAYEMARQLKAQGEEVALVALFDTMNWCAIPRDNAWRKMRHVAQRIKFHGKNFLLLNAVEKKKFFEEKVKVLRSRSKIWRGMLASKFGSNEPGNKSESRVLAEMWQINDRACVVYQAPPYDGVVTDFRPMRQYTKYRPAENDWSRLALGGYEILTLPVYPAGMLLEPFVKHLADALKATISRTIR